jgi:hypothetical protein
MRTRREILALMGLAPISLCKFAWPESENTDYMKPAKQGRTISSLSEARGARNGDVILLRDMAKLAPSDAYSHEFQRGKWQLRPYQLADGQSGELLMVNDWAKFEAAKAVPPPFEIKLDLSGWYAIWIGIPRLEFHPFSVWDGVDVALDGDTGFTPILAERGFRHNNLMGPKNVEIMCFWKCTKLDGRTLRVRNPTGTYFSSPWGFVRGSMSALRLVKLSDAQVHAYQKDISNPATKRVIIVHDGNSDLITYGEPGGDVEERLVTAYRDSDVKMLIYQAITNGATTWPSKVTSLIGDDMTEDLWKVRRMADRRGTEYIRQSVKNGREPMKVVSQLCRKVGIQCHAGMRMNQLFATGHTKPDPNWNGGLAVGEWLNGSWWREHPEVRKPGKPDLDYAFPAARQYMIDLLTELTTNYDLDGVCLDFTRWAPIADPKRHDTSVLTNFIKEIRHAMDGVARTKRSKLALSVQVADGIHWPSMEEQKVDLEAWLATGTLDFICVEAYDQAKYIAMAKRHHVPYYALQDNESFQIKSDADLKNDAEWYTTPPADAFASQEFQEQPYVESNLDPTEYDQGFLERYQMGADGACLVNNMWGWRSTGRLGHIEEMTKRARTKEIWGQEVGPRIDLLPRRTSL